MLGKIHNDIPLRYTLKYEGNYYTNAMIPIKIAFRLLGVMLMPMYEI